MESLLRKQLERDSHWGLFPSASICETAVTKQLSPTVTVKEVTFQSLSSTVTIVEVTFQSLSSIVTVKQVTFHHCLPQWPASKSHSIIVSHSDRQASHIPVTVSHGDRQNKSHSSHCLLQWPSSKSHSRHCLPQWPSNKSHSSQCLSAVLFKERQYLCIICFWGFAENNQSVLGCCW